MNTNRIKILQMLKEGTISLEDAERLLERIDEPANSVVEEDDIVTLEELDDAVGLYESAGAQKGGPDGANVQVEFEVGGEPDDERLQKKIRIKKEIGSKVQDVANAAMAAVARQIDKRAKDHGTHGRNGKGAKFLRIQIETSDGNDVDLRLPIALIRAGIKLTALVPNKAREALKDAGVDIDSLSSLDPEAIVKAIEELTVDIETADGCEISIHAE